MSLKPIRIVLLGAPGSGKGTLTTRLLKNVSQLNSLSTGDILRREMQQNSEIGITAKNYIKNGQLLPDHLMAQLLNNELSKLGWLSNESSWLLDGFPRTIGQAEELDKNLDPFNCNVNSVVELDVPPEVILERIENRWVHIPSGRVYNLQYNPPKVPGKDDITGEPLSKRDDDKPEIFKLRLDSYFKELEPLKEYYYKKNILRTVSGETSDIVFPKLLDLVLQEFKK